MSERAEIRILQVLAASFIIVKLIYVFGAGPISDEAYYWMWGRHPGLSYFDHPPFQSWMLGLSYLFFGRSLFALRWLTIVCMAGTFVIYRLWARRYFTGDAERFFWRAVTVYLASTTFGFFTSLAFHDYMLIFLVLLAGHFFLTYFTDLRAGKEARLRNLYLGALVLGLAGLTKYNAVFLGLGVVGFVLFDRRLRPLLLRPHIYLAGVLTIALQGPVIIWNVQHGFASFGFHLGARHPAEWLTRINWATIADFVATSTILVSPFLIPAFVRFLASRPQGMFEDTAKVLGTWVFWLSSLTFLAVSAFDLVFWWWNVVAYVLLIPFAARYMGRWLMAGHIAFGAILAVFLLISSVVAPLPRYFGLPDLARSRLFGWDQLEVPIHAAEAQHPGAFIASFGPEAASIAGFALDDPEVTALHPWINQYDFWWDAEAHRGKDAILILEAHETDADVAPYFELLTPITEIPVVRFGLEINRYRLVLGHGYLPPPS